MGLTGFDTAGVSGGPGGAWMGVVSGFMPILIDYCVFISHHPIMYM